MRPAPFISLACALIAAAATLSACETTRETSARLSRNAEKLLDVKGVKITKVNATVKVVARTVLHDANGIAAVVFVRNSGPAQANVPIGIAVQDSKGKSLYSNSIPGLDPSLTSLPVIDHGERTFWVNNQITAAGRPRRISAEVGVADSGAPRTVPRIEISKIAFGHDTSGEFARGVIANRSKVVQRRLVVSCVSRADDRVVAAGRSIVERLQPAPTPKPVTFRVYFIGKATKGRLSCAAPPTVLEGGK